MSRIENGITHNSFYETDKELDFEPRTKEELISSLKTDVGNVTLGLVLKKIRK